MKGINESAEEHWFERRRTHSNRKRRETKKLKWLGAAKTRASLLERLRKGSMSIVVETECTEQATVDSRRSGAQSTLSKVALVSRKRKGIHCGTSGHSPGRWSV